MQQEGPLGAGLLADLSANAISTTACCTSIVPGGGQQALNHDRGRRAARGQIVRIRMATIHEITAQSDTAQLADGRLVLEFFTEDDPVVIRVVSQAEDVAEAAHTCIQVGARALLSGHAALDEVLVGRSFDQLVDRLNATVDLGVGRIADTATHLLGEDDGALTTST